MKSLCTKSKKLIILTFLILTIIITYTLLSLTLFKPSYAQSREIMIDTNHYLGIRYITFTNKLSNIITFGYDGKIIKWDLNNLSISNSLNITKNDITSISITYDKSILCIGFSDGYIILVDVEGLKIVKSFQLHIRTKIISIAISNDKRNLIVITSNNNLKIFSLDDFKLLKAISNKDFTGYIPKIDSNNRLVVFYKSDEIILYSLHIYSIIKRINIDKNKKIYDIVFSEDGKKIYLAGESGILYYIDIGLSYSLFTICKSPNNSWIHSFSIDKFSNIAYINSEKNIYYYNSKLNENILIYNSQEDIVNINLERYGRYVAFTSLTKLYIIKIDI